MADYKLVGDGVLYVAQGLYIPEDTSNRHWQEYLAWLDKGNEPEAADDPPPPSTIELIADAGRATLVGGTVTVSTLAIQSDSLIFLQRKTPLGTMGFLSIGTIVSGASFVINSVNPLDVSMVDWFIIG